MQNDILYHYCSVDAFIKIIQTGSLFLTNVDYMNDYMERKWIWNIIGKEIARRLAGQSSLSTIFYTMFEEKYKAHLWPCSTYAVCFSEEPDVLSQWRAYAQDGFGVSIGFNKGVLLSILGDNTDLTSITYDEHKQTLDIRPEAQKIAEEIKCLLDKLAPEQAVDKVLTDYLMKERFLYSKYKNPAFSEEKEWRIIRKLAPPFSSVNKENYKFRTSGDGTKIIPYCLFDFSPNKAEVISDFWLGPKSQLHYDEIALLLHSSGLNGNIPPQRSRASYK